jgi:hypothetical protein
VTTSDNNSVNKDNDLLKQSKTGIVDENSEFLDLEKDPGFVQILYQVEIRLKTVIIAKIVLFLFALKPLLLKTYGFLDAQLDFAYFSLTHIEWIELIIPITLSIIWLIINRSEIGYFITLVLIILLCYLLSKDPGSSQILMLNLFVIVTVLAAARAQGQVERFEKNFKILKDIPRYKRYKKFKLKQKNNVIKS